jgi:hypothetical protein
MTSKAILAVSHRFHTMPELLPVELINHVIDELHGDERSLRACSLVHRSWTDQSRRHLFHTIYVDDGAQHDQLLAVLNESPSIARHVQRVSQAGNFRSPTEQAAKLFDLFTRLPHLHWLMVDDLDWSRVHPTTREQINFAAFSSQLHSLALRYCSFLTPVSFIMFLHQFTALEAVMLKSLHFSSNDDDAAIGEDHSRRQGPYSSVSLSDINASKAQADVLGSALICKHLKLDLSEERRFQAYLSPSVLAKAVQSASADVLRDLTIEYDQHGCEFSVHDYSRTNLSQLNCSKNDPTGRALGT